MRIRYSAILDGPSGYAQFARGFLAAFKNLGIPVDVYPIPRFSNPLYKARFKSTLGRDRDALPTPDVNIINAVPSLLLQYREPGAINLGFTMFETDRLPEEWVRICNQMDGLIVPCEWNREVFAASGVHVPIFVVPPGIDVPQSSATQRSSNLTPFIRNALSKHDTAYKFYSIFQWRERKNPVGLLRAYFSEFGPGDNVCLVLKTYYSGFRNKFAPRHERRRIMSFIRDVQRSMNLKYFPAVLPVVRHLSNREINALHAMCDCFVLPHRAEGLGMPHMAAMAHGKPAIVTGYSGNMEFMNNETAFLLPYQFTPVFNMDHDAYHGDMMWAEPDLGVLRKLMRDVYADRPLGKRYGRRGREHIKQQFGWSKSIDRLMHALCSLVPGNEYNSILERSEEVIST